MCGAPTTLRDVHLHASAGPGTAAAAGDAIWWCAPGGDASRGHVMTSQSLVGYGTIDFSPKQVFHDVTEVCWDMNRTEMGGRKWAQVTIVPEAEYQATGGLLNYVQSNLEGDVGAAGTTMNAGFMLSTARSATWMQLPNDDDLILDSGAGDTGSDKATRLRHCVSDTAAGVRITIHWPDGREMADATRTGYHLPDGPVRVIFQDATYDSLKGDMSQAQALQTNTWHWDNISIS
jgi:hypothetical protein